VRACVSLSLARALFLTRSGLPHSLWFALARSCVLLLALARALALACSLTLSPCHTCVLAVVYSVAHACVSPPTHTHTQSAGNERQIAPFRPGRFDDPTAQGETWDSKVSASPCRARASWSWAARSVCVVQGGLPQLVRGNHACRAKGLQHLLGATQRAFSLFYMF